LPPLCTMLRTTAPCVYSTPQSYTHLFGCFAQWPLASAAPQTSHELPQLLQALQLLAGHNASSTPSPHTVNPTNSEAISNAPYAVAAPCLRCAPQHTRQPNAKRTKSSAVLHPPHQVLSAVAPCLHCAPNCAQASRNFFRLSSCHNSVRCNK
jgi:hypothetical protein